MSKILLVLKKNTLLNLNLKHVHILTIVTMATAIIIDAVFYI